MSRYLDIDSHLGQGKRTYLLEGEGVLVLESVYNLLEIKREIAKESVLECLGKTWEQKYLNIKILINCE